MRSRKMRVAHLVGIALLAGTLGGCVDTSAPSPAATPVTEVLQSLTLAPRALVMAVGDTATVTADAKNIFGDTIAIPDSTPVVWSSSDPRIITVDSAGKLRAVTATTADEFVTITATWTHRASTKTDQVFVNVTPTREPIAGIKIRARDSTRTSSTEFFLEAFTSFGVLAVDANGDSVGMPRIPVNANDTLQQGQVFALYLGSFGVFFGADQYVLSSYVIGDYYLYASATVYGTPMRDSLKFTGLYPANTRIILAQDSASRAIVSALSGQEAFVQPCAQVKFDNQTPGPIDIVFDNPALASGCGTGELTGDIVGLGAGSLDIRKFPAVGSVRWTYRDPATGQLVPAVSGKITMKVP